MIKVAIHSTQEIIKWALQSAFAQPIEGSLDPEISCVTENPDVMLVDIDACAGGLDAARAIFLVSPCVAFGRRLEMGFAARVILAGARAYVSLIQPPLMLLDAIAGVARGERPLSSELVSAVAEGGPTGCLTARELSVMELLARGFSCREIAEQLEISIKTVDTHRGHVLKKLSLRSAADLVRFAERYGLAGL